MEIKCIVNGKWAENCYIVSHEQDAVIIDPGGNFELIKEYINTHQYNVWAVINTHAHFDHIGAVADVVDEYKCPFYLHSGDKRLLKSANLYMSLFMGEAPVRVPAIDVEIDKTVLPLVFNTLSVEVLFTPGHTEGGVCFLINDHLFTGDTLMNGSIGRLDLPGGNKEKMKRSLQMIAELPAQLPIYPGHGGISTIGEELANNEPFTSLLK
jgi:hydroxyacylglutathione hydrolase